MKNRLILKHAVLSCGFVTASLNAQFMICGVLYLVLPAIGFAIGE